MYAALAYHDSLPNGRAAGELIPDSSGLTFRADALSQAIPLRGLVVKHGGTAGRLIWFTHPELAGWSFSTGDGAILHDPVLERLAGLAEQTGRVRGGRRRARGVLIMLAILLAVLLAAIPIGLWLGRGPLTAAAVKNVPLVVDQKIGEVMEKSLDFGADGRRVLKDEALHGELEKLLAPLRPMLREEFAWRVYILDDDTPNAFAAPGGLMVIHSGLLTMVDSGDEVVGVMAHEIVHCNQRHGIRGLVRQMGSVLLLNAVIGDIGSVTTVLVEGSRRLWLLGNSREMEYEADDVAWTNLCAAGLDPRGMTEVFRKLEGFQAANGLGIAIPEMLSTHPDTAARIAALEQRWTETPDSDTLRKTDFDYTEFKKRLQETINAQ